MSRAFLTPIGVARLASNPGSGTSGDVYYNTADNTLRYYNGTSWSVLASTGDTGSFQPLDADLTAIAGLAGTSGFLKKTAANTWALDTNTYLTTNQTVTLSGDVSGSGSTSITVTLGNSGVVAGTYNDAATQVRPFTVDAKGRITSIGTAVTIAPAFSSVTGKPTTLSGYGITDAATLASPTFTGTVNLPTTNISGVATFSNYLNRVTANGNSSWLQQDGTGRTHWYWNTLGGASPTFTNAAEDASALSLHITGTSAGGSLFHRSASGVGKNAGDAITWTTTLYVDLNSITYKGNNIWHAGNDGAGSGLDADTVDGIQASALAALASPTFTGVPTAPTAAADTNTTQLATTAFVVGQAGSATPAVNGTAAVGTSLRYARQDHVHGTDTTRAPLASPAFTGTITGASLNLSAEIQSEAGTKDDLTTRTKSGFWQTSSATTAEGWPETSNSWAHLISSTHSNTGNYYALQIAASFYSTDSVYVRVTNGSGTAPWKRMLHEGNTAHIHPFMLSCI